MLWADLQEVFYILLGDFIARLLLPVFIAAGLLLSILMSIAKFWRPAQPVEITNWKQE